MKTSFSAQKDNNSKTEAQQHKQLRNMKLLALLLLILMCILLIASRMLQPTYHWIRWIGVFAEAAMIGALADWFAVTALFRHPFGLPIPHTAIIPKNKDRIAITLGNFIQTNFLNEENVSNRMRELNPTQRTAQWLSNSQNAQRIAQEISAAVPEILKTCNDSDVRSFIQRVFSLALDDLPVAKIAGNILETLSGGNKYKQLTDDGLKLFERFLNNHQEYIRDTIREELPWYVPSFIHNKIYTSIINKIKEKITEVNADPEHQIRIKIHCSIEAFITNLKISPEFHAQGEKIKLWVFSNTHLKEYAGLVWDDIRQSILNDLEKQNSKLRESLSNGISALGSMLSTDTMMQSKINGTIETAVKGLVQNHREDLIALISDTVNRWDSATIIEKLELQVGKDLQYIRLNGTLVGGLAGVVIYFITSLIQ